MTAKRRYAIFQAVIVGAIGCAQSMAVIKIQLQPFGCTKAVLWLYLFAVYLMLKYINF